MGEPSFSHGKDEMLAAAVAALHTLRCRGGFVVFGSWCARHSLSPLGWQAPVWSCIPGALPHPESGPQGRASLGLAAAFAALWEPVL